MGLGLLLNYLMYVTLPADILRVHPTGTLTAPIVTGTATATGELEEPEEPEEVEEPEEEEEEEDDEEEWFTVAPAGNPFNPDVNPVVNPVRFGSALTWFSTATVELLSCCCCC